MRYQITKLKKMEIPRECKRRRGRAEIISTDDLKTKTENNGKLKWGRDLMPENGSENEKKSKK